MAVEAGTGVLLTRAELEAAHQRIRDRVHRTPVMTARTFDRCLETELFFKCENFQRVGAFKFRGAFHAVSRLTSEARARGVTTHSSGNHAQAVALAAREAGIVARVVMPRDAPRVKVEAVRGYGAEVVLCEPGFDNREAAIREVIAEHGSVLIHPYEDLDVIAGASTAAKELLEEIPDLDLIVPPLGGGGLMSGTVLAAHHFSPATKVIAAEPEGADDGYRSFVTGERQPAVHPPATLADGLLMPLGSLTFSALRRHAEAVVTVTDEEIVNAMRLVWERMKIVIEPSAAVPFAAVLAGKIDVRGKRVGLIVSGGNVDLDRLPWLRG